ncbi:ABC transporter substrate-binding protein [candidate division KSB1 bacterium]|nr:ABC transporter substrate-binding protein [candidate division KSB1 bacterium]
MLTALKRLSLGILLILAASAILLFSDLQQRKGPEKTTFRVALFQFASRLPLDQNVEGVINGLASEGLKEGDRLILQRYNAQNDMATANNIAQEIINQRYDMVITLSTLCLQTMANANKKGDVVHVFNMVTDPYGAGVEIGSDQPGDHPEHLIGIGSFQPVEDCFRLARHCLPELKVVGTVWNPAETCSEACLIKARVVAQELGIRLLEATVDNSAGVYEAAQSLVSRGCEALWVGCDNTVDAAITAMVRAAQQGRIALISNEPRNAEQGALFGIGANYYDTGQLTGMLAAKILSGADPAKMSVKNVVPLQLYLNTAALARLRQPWQFSDDLMAETDVIVDQAGVHKKKTQDRIAEMRKMLPLIYAGADLKEKTHKKWNIHVVKYLESPACEQSEAGIYKGIKESGLREGIDYEIRARSAQGDMASLSVLMDAVITENADMVVPLSTPTLQAAIRKVQHIPVVFTHIADPIVAGAGRSVDDHLPNITGAYNLADYSGLIAGVCQCIPGVKRVGSLYSPSESNSIWHKNNLEAAGKKLNVEVVTIGVNTSAEVSDGAMALCGMGVDAICQIADNICDGGFASIAQAAARSKVPLSGFASHNLEKGAFLVFARDFEDTGREAGLLIARIIRGEDPAQIPFHTIASSKILINLPVARALGITVPPELLMRAEKIVE